MDVNYCRRCGTPTAHKSGGMYVCKNRHELYYKSYCSTGILLQNEKQEVLLSVRGIEPAKGVLDLPGGFCDVGETFEEAGKRELHEELGLLPEDYSELVYLCNDVDDYLYQGENQPVICVVFTAMLRTNKKIEARDDVAAVQWVPLAAFNESALAPGFNALRRSLRLLREQKGLEATA